MLVTRYRSANKPLHRLALAISQLKPSDFPTLRIGTLAPFSEITTLSGPIPTENDMLGFGALYVRLRLSVPRVVLG